MAKPAGSDEITPTLNRFIQSTASKGESVVYADIVQSLAVVKTVGDGKQAAKEAVERQLARLMQYGALSLSTVEPLLKSLAVEPGKEGAEDKAITRLLFYLVQLALGDGFAGTPLFVPPGRGNITQPKAVDRFGPEVLSAAWADLGNERSPFMRKQGAMRALAALAHASLTSRPDDPTYPAGVFVTLQSLLERIDSLRASKKSLAAVLTAQRVAAGSASMKRKNQVVEFKQRMEMWGLLRLALSAARVALSRSGLAQVAAKSFTGLTAADPVCARHALALASLMAREPQGSASYIDAVGPLLRNNVDVAAATGTLFSRAGAGGPDGRKTGGGGPGAPPPSVVRDDAETHVNLRDTWARMYLARGCASAIQSGHIAGDIQGAGAPFWSALVLLAVADPSEQVALEAIKAMFGAPYPHGESIRKRPSYAPAPGSEHDVEAASQSKIYAASWHMIMSVADAAPSICAGGGSPVPSQAMIPPHDALLAATGEGPGSFSPTTRGDAVSSDGGAKAAAASSLFGRIVSRLLAALGSRSRALTVAAVRTAGILFEARAWCGALSGAGRVETEGVHRAMRVLQSALTAIFAAEGAGAAERAAAGEALLWAQPGAILPEERPTITPAQLLRAASQGGLAVPNVTKALFADPWPEPLVGSFLSALQRRQRCAPALAPWCLSLAAALTAAAPSRVPKDALQALWDAAPGPMSVRASLEVVGSPLPPVTMPPAAAPVEVKALAAAEEAAYEVLRGLAAWWLGEHVNAVAGVVAWKPPPKPSVKLPFLAASGGAAHSQAAGAGHGADGVHAAAGSAASGVAALEPMERVALGAAAHAPLLTMAIAHLQRAMYAGSWEVRSAAAQALGKVAVRSPEPFRIQAYAVLSGCVRVGSTGATSGANGSSSSGGAAAGAGGSGWGSGVGAAAGALGASSSAPGALATTGVCDPLGLAPVVCPVLELLDAMYAGELVVAQQCNLYGAVADGWPAPALASLQRRHEWLLATIAQRVGGVPRDVFFPLGRRSRALLRPEEPPEPEAVEEEEEDAAALDAAAAAAAAAAAGEGGYEGEQYDEQYDTQYSQYYGEDAYYGAGGEADPLAKWQAGDYGAEGRAAAVAAVAWRGMDDEGGAASHDASSAVDEEDARWATVQYTFSAETDEELGVAAGERVRVYIDMGDWLHVSNASGRQGLVPASYVQYDESGGHGDATSGSASAALSPRASTSIGGATGYGHDADHQQASYGAYGGGYDAFGDAGDYGAGMGAYGSAGKGSMGTFGAYGAEDEDADKKGMGSGFDDFGAALAAAAEARAQAQARAAAQAQAMQNASLQRTVSRSSTSSSFSTAPQSNASASFAGRQPSASGQSSLGGAFTSGGGGWGSTAGAPPQAGVAAPAAQAFGGFGDEAPAGWASFGDDAFQTAAAQAPFPASAGGAAGPAPELSPRPSVASTASAQPSPASAAFGGVPAAGEEAGAAPAALPAVAGRGAAVLYDFNAEMENELSVRTGDVLEIQGEVDGWYQVLRLADGQAGLIPANYVELQ